MELPHERYLTVEFRPEGIAELDPADLLGRLVFIRRDEVRTISVGRGAVAERPALQVVAGLALLGAGVWLLLGFIAMVFDLEGGGSLRFAWALGAFCLGLGGWALREGLRRGAFVRVETSSGMRKLALHGEVDDATLREFVARMALAHGYRSDRM
jgi:hypothetical protein